MKRKFKFTVIAVLAIAVVACVTNNESVNKQDRQDLEYESVIAELEALKSQTSLNVETRVAKWWKWLIVGAVDAGVGFGTANPGAGVAASALTFTMLQADSKAAEKPEGKYNPSIKPVSRSLNNLEIEGTKYGALHNQVIINLYQEHGESLFENTQEDLMGYINAELAQMRTAYVHRIIRLDDITPYLDEYVNAKSLDDFFKGLARLHPDKINELNVLKVIIEGFEHVDMETDNGEYATAAIRIINASDMSLSNKTALAEGISIANASFRLWNLP